MSIDRASRLAASTAAAFIVIGVVLSAYAEPKTERLNLPHLTVEDASRRMERLLDEAARWRISLVAFKQALLFGGCVVSLAWFLRRGRDAAREWAERRDSRLSPPYGLPELLGMGGAVIAASSLPAAVARFADLPPPSAGTTLIADMVAFTAAPAVLPIFLRIRKASLDAVGFVGDGPAARQAATGLLAYVVLLPILTGVEYGAQEVIVRLYEAWGEELSAESHLTILLSGRVSGGTLLTMAVWAVVGAPVVEEIIFRGVLYGVFRKRLGPTAAALVSGAIFAAVHLSMRIFAPLFLLGTTLALLRERTGGLLAPVALHAANNLVSVLVMAAFAPV